MKKSILITIISAAVTLAAATTGIALSLSSGGNDNNDQTSTSSVSCTHNYASATTKQATCKETGIKTYTCTLCGNFYTEDIQKTSNHSYTSEVTKEATCKDMGVKTYTCGVCEDFYTEDIEKTSNHSYTSEVTKEATCKDMGVKTYTCVECGDSYTEDIEKNDSHKSNENLICMICGKDLTIIMTENEQNAASIVEYLGYQSIQHNDAENKFCVRFALADALHTPIAAPAIVKLKIINDLGITVFQAVKQVATSDFSKKDQDILMAEISIDYNELTQGRINTGMLYMEVFNKDYFSFDQVALEITAPITIELPTTPITLNCWWIDGSLEMTVKITNISYVIKTTSNKKYL